MHIWMHEIWFSFEECMLKSWFFYFLLFKWKCLFECMKFYFYFSWMIMYILMHEIIFLFLNSLSFSMIMYLQFFNDFTNDFFFSKFFKDNVSKRYVQIFQKRRYVQNIFSIIFKCFKIYVQFFFLIISSNVYSEKYVQRFF